MAIALRAGTTGPSISASSTTISLPSGTTVNDVTVFATAQTGSNTLTAPAGWTTLRNIPGVLVCYRVFQSGDPSTITVTSTGANWFETAIVSYSGCDTSTPIDTSNSCLLSQGVNQVTSALYRAPSLNPNFAADQLLCIYLHDDSPAGGTITLPSGLTARASTSAGPSVCIADKALTDGTPTGNQDATWDSVLGTRHFGMQVALKASGASTTTVAAPAITFAGLYGNTAIGNITIPLDKLSPQQGDLVVVGTACNVAVTPPSGYALVQSGGGASLYTHAWSAGDSTSPVFAVGGGGDINVAAFLLRKTGTGTATPTLDTSGINTATATVSTPGLTPAGTGELLLCFYGNASTLAGTWTSQPAGLTKDLLSGWGPCYLSGWVEPAANPTGTFSATNSVAATVGAIAALFRLPSAGVTLPLTGAASTAAVGTLAPSSALALSGNAATGNAGTAGVAVNVALTGAGGTGAAGNATAVTGQAIALTGVESATVPGSVGAGIDLALSGNALTGNAGSVAPSQSLTGVQASDAAGMVGVSTSAALTGTNGTAAPGALSPAVTLALSGVHATDAVGMLAPSQALTGVSGTGEVGTLSPRGVMTGVAGTGAVGHLGPSVTVALSGNALTGNVGTLAAGSDKVIGLSGSTGTGSAGSFAAFMQALLTGCVSATAVDALTPTTGLAGVASGTASGSLQLNSGLSLGGVAAVGLTGLAYPIRPDTGHGHVFIINYRHEFIARIRSVQRTIRQTTDQRSAVTGAQDCMVQRGDDERDIYSAGTQDVLVEA